ncbi:MAG: class I SAM-dependent methyltransferase [Bryobacteraceae bacterium]|nr:class I SAM-dependent methyltransferase [Bryobacteraceae bacterium]
MFAPRALEPVAAPEDARAAVTQCPACEESCVRTLFSGSDRLYRTTTKTFYVVECVRCRLIRLDPQPTPAELREFYPANYWFEPEADSASRLAEAYRHFVIRDHVNFALGALRSVGPLNGRQPVLLDVGCGGGLFIHHIQRAGYPVLGLDFSIDAAELAWRRHHVPAFVGTLTQAPLAPGRCGVVTMFHVLEHLFHPTEYLEAAHELLHPEGRLIIQVPNAACLQFLLLGEHWNGLDVPRHLWDFRPDDLEVLLDQCGFESVRHKHFNLRDNPAGMATSLAPGLDPMSRRIRGVQESSAGRLAKDLTYLGLTMACLPFTLLEAACRAGSSIMVEARKKKGA